MDDTHRIVRARSNRDTTAKFHFTACADRYVRALRADQQVNVDERFGTDSGIDTVTSPTSQRLARSIVVGAVPKNAKNIYHRMFP